MMTHRKLSDIVCVGALLQESSHSLHIALSDGFCQLLVQTRDNWGSEALGCPRINASSAPRALTLSQLVQLARAEIRMRWRSAAGEAGVGERQGTAVWVLLVSRIHFVELIAVQALKVDLVAFCFGIHEVLSLL